MNFTRTTLVGVLMAASLLFARNVFALSTGAVAAGAFTPVYSTDVPYITNYGVYLANGDSSAAHYVAAHLGLYNGIAQGVTFMGDNNGGTVTCTVYVVDTVNLNQWFYTNSTSATGVYTLNISIPASLTGSAVISGNCQIPAHNSSGYSELYLAK